MLKNQRNVNAHRKISGKIFRESFASAMGPCGAKKIAAKTLSGGGGDRKV
jgi:hypothetical protein